MSTHPAQAMLWKAIDDMHAGAVMVSLAMGADPNAKDERQRTPLHRAMDVGFSTGLEPGVISALFQHDANAFSVDPNNGQTLLMKAVALRSEKLSNTFVEMGIPVSQGDHQGRTPLMVAAGIGSVSLCETLLNSAHQPTALLAARDNLGRTALMASTPHPEVALNLLSSGADPRPADHENRTAMDMNTDPVVRNIMKAKANILDAQDAARLQASKEQAADLQGVMQLAQRMSSTLLGPATRKAIPKP